MGCTGSKPVGICPATCHYGYQSSSIVRTANSLREKAGCLLVHCALWGAGPAGCSGLHSLRSSGITCLKVPQPQEEILARASRQEMLHSSSVFSGQRGKGDEACQGARRGWDGVNVSLGPLPVWPPHTPLGLCGGKSLENLMCCAHTCVCGHVWGWMRMPEVGGNSLCLMHDL